MSRFSFLTFLLVLSLFISGVVVSAFGFLSSFPPFLFFLLTVPLLFLARTIAYALYSGMSRVVSLGEKKLLLLLSGIWTVHLTGVLVPETGFDAVWYHLPILQKFYQVGHIFYIPEMYQSANPLFSDLIFFLGYQWSELAVTFGFHDAKDFGTKAVAYLFGLAFIFTLYCLSRQMLNRYWSLMVVIVVSTFQVVGWQSTSFYIDIAKALWEVASLWMMLEWATKQKKEKKYKFSFLLLFAALFLGASFATKLFSILLLPLFLGLPFILLQGDQMRKKYWVAGLLLFISLSVALPFYLFTYFSTGNPFYSLSVHIEKLSEIGGGSLPCTQVVTDAITCERFTVWEYFVQRLVSFPTSLTNVTLFSRDYISLLFLVFLGLAVGYLKEMWNQPKLKAVFFFAGSQWLIWWFVPPLSTRYALSGFAVLTVLYLWTLSQFSFTPTRKKLIILTLFLIVSTQFLPRLAVMKRNVEYVYLLQTKEEYLQQFYDGNIDVHLKKWHMVQ